MKKLLLIYILVLTAGISSAQSGTECIYHIQLQNFKWTYAKFTGNDTIAVYDPITGDIVRDTLIWDTAMVVWGANRNIFSYPFPDTFSLANNLWRVTSCDGKEEIKVKEFTVTFRAFDTTNYDYAAAIDKTIKIKGAALSPSDISKFNNVAFVREQMEISFTLKIEGMKEELELGSSPIIVKRKN